MSRGALERGWTVFAGESSGRCALELARRALREGELDTALVCGVIAPSTRPLS